MAHMTQRMAANTRKQVLDVCKFSAVLLGVVLGSTTVFVQCAQGQALAAHPALLPGEIFAITQNGCGIALNTDGADTIQTFQLQSDGNTTAVQQNVLDYVASQEWTGDCGGGLAHGWGKFGPPGENGIDGEFWPYSEFAYGRELGRTRSATGDTSYVLREGDSVSAIGFSGLGDDASIPPRWVSFDESIWGGSSISMRDINVRTNATTCYTDTKLFRGCRGEGYAVYGVTVQTLGTDGQVVEHWCPNPKSTKGCEALWEELAGPSLASAREAIAVWEQKTQSIVSQYAELSAPWLAEADQRAAARAEAEQAASVAAAQAEAEAEANRREQAEAEAAAFDAQLAAANAGELFLLAQDLDAAGRSDDAQRARRALIAGFSDNALAATAAEQLVAKQTAAAVVAPSGIERCLQVENASPIATQLSALPADNINLQTRGIIAAADFLIETYTQCLPDPQARAIVDENRATRESALATCRAVSTVDNCGIPPFGSDYEAEMQRQQQEAARLQAEYEAAEDERELQQSIQTFIDVLEQYTSDGESTGAAGGDECGFNSDGDPTTVCTVQ